MKSNRNKILLLVIGVAIAIAGLGYCLYNKEHVNVEDSKGVSVNALDLYHTYFSDSIAANKIYGNKIVEVAGEVKSVGMNEQKQQLIMMASGNPSASVNCTLEKNPATVPAVGTKIIVKGICSGIGEGDEELGIPADVYVTRGYLMQSK